MHAKSEVSFNILCHSWFVLCLHPVNVASDNKLSWTKQKKLQNLKITKNNAICVCKDLHVVAEIITSASDILYIVFFNCNSVYDKQWF